MKSTSIISTAILGLSLSLTSCFKDDIGCVQGRGELETEHRTVEAFSKILLKGSADITLIQYDDSDFSDIEISAQDEILEVLETRVVGDRLIIDFKEKCVSTNRPIRLTIKTAQLSAVEIEGSGNVEGQTAFSGTSLDLDIEGSGDMDLELNYDDMDIQVDGSGNLRLEGSTKELNIDITGSGDVKARKLESSNCDIHIEGSGDSEVNVSDQLKVRIEGSGDIRYEGSPSTDIRIDGSGSVSRY